MALLHHDMTGTQTDCEKPLSRKKLRTLVPHSRNDLTAGALRNPKNPFHIAGRLRGWKIWAIVAQKREQRHKLRKLLEKKTLPDGTTYQLVPTAAELEVIKPTMFERLGSLFGNLRKRAEREKAKGK